MEQVEAVTKKLNVGWIPYWNLAPHRIELARYKIEGLQFFPGHPTEVNRMLGDGTVLCAPASAVSVLLNPRLEIAAPAGVSSNGPVLSVYLGLKGETSYICELVRTRLALAKDIIKDALDETGDSYRRAAALIWQELDATPCPDLMMIPKLKLSAASASGAVLSKLFFRLIFGKSAYETTQVAAQYVNTDVPTLELVIGDEALARRQEFTKIFDLGQMWKVMTGLPFVFSVWQKSQQSIVPEALVQSLIQSAEAAEAKMHIEPSAYFPDIMPLAQHGQEIDLAGYWRCINYRIGPKEIQGLLLYLCLARPLVRAEMDDQMVIKMLRWQQIAENR